MESQVFVLEALQLSDELDLIAEIYGTQCLRTVKAALRTAGAEGRTDWREVAYEAVQDWDSQSGLPHFQPDLIAA